MKKVVVIGAGPAGMFAAIHAKNKNNQVTILESNERLGKKLAITGKGRCNLTNSKDITDFFDEVNTNKDFLYSAFYSYPNTSLMDFFSKDIKLKVERGLRVFPSSDSAFDVIDVLRNKIQEKDIQVKLNTKVENIQYKDKFNIYTNKVSYQADYLVIATGGKSYPKTGSDGSGYLLSKALGHTIVKPIGSLVPIETNEDWIFALKGLSLKNVTLSLWNNNKKLKEEFGEMLFSHYGISGPIALTMSSYIDLDKNYVLKLDLKPALDLDKLDARILRDFEKYKNKDITNAMKDLLLSRLIPIVLNLAGIDDRKKVNQISKEERKKLGQIIKAIPMSFKSLRPISEAIITQGGVEVNEINPSTMESKILENLYFAGEIIDVDANTGGYNLQIAFSTGYLAGKTINEVTNWQ